MCMPCYELIAVSYVVDNPLRFIKTNKLFTKIHKISCSRFGNRGGPCKTGSLFLRRFALTTFSSNLEC